MAKEFHRPVSVDGAWLEYFASANNPEDGIELAHKSAWTLISRMQGESEENYQRLLQYIDSEGIEELADIWSHAPHPSLPATLWRIYLVWQLARLDPAQLSVVYRVGLENINSTDSAVAGAQEPVGPSEIMALTDQILRGVFTGDFAVALNRAAAFCKISSVGNSKLADDSEFGNSERASKLTKRALNLSKISAELSQAAKLWQDKKLG